MVTIHRIPGGEQDTMFNMINRLRLTIACTGGNEGKDGTDDDDVDEVLHLNW